MYRILSQKLRSHSAYTSLVHILSDLEQRRPLLFLLNCFHFYSATLLWRWHHGCIFLQSLSLKIDFLLTVVLSSLLVLEPYDFAFHDLRLCKCISLGLNRGHSSLGTLLFMEHTIIKHGTWEDSEMLRLMKPCHVTCGVFLRTLELLKS